LYIYHYSIQITLKKMITWTKSQNSIWSWHKKWSQAVIFEKGPFTRSIWINMVLMSLLSNKSHFTYHNVQHMYITWMIETECVHNLHFCSENWNPLVVNLSLVIYKFKFHLGYKIHKSFIYRDIFHIQTDFIGTS
jgi:hypothetical protein